MGRGVVSVQRRGRMAAPERERGHPTKSGEDREALKDAAPGEQTSRPAERGAEEGERDRHHDGGPARVVL